MHSSEFAKRASQALVFVLLLGVLGCAAAPSVAPAVTVAAAAAPCAASGGDTKEASPGAQELLRSVQASPLFAVAIAPAGIASCTLAVEDGQTTISYESSNGNRLVIRRDERIESTSQEARFRAPPLEAPLAILAFGTAGCGVAWERPASASGASNAVVTSYRGDVCNCQAHVERNPAGEVVALALKSAC
jgi:hypothetical protein